MSSFARAEEPCCGSSHEPGGSCQSVPAFSGQHHLDLLDQDSRGTMDQASSQDAVSVLCDMSHSTLYIGFYNFKIICSQTGGAYVGTEPLLVPSEVDLLK